MSNRPPYISAAVALAGLMSFGVSAHTTLMGSDCRLLLTPLEERLYEKHNEGSEALRRFIVVRRGIVEADFNETVDWAAAVDAARSRCLVRQGQLQVPTQPQRDKQGEDLAQIRN